jgi:uncharacterized membrane-anchored protein
MGKNHFLGGSTIIPPGSDWYSGIDDPEPRRRTENERLERERKRSLQMASATARQAKEIKKIATKQRRSDEEKVSCTRVKSLRAQGRLFAAGPQRTNRSKRHLRKRFGKKQ